MAGPVTQVSGGASSSLALADIGLRSTDYGVQGSLAYELKLGDSFAFWHEARYLRGLANVSTDGSSTAYFEEAQGLLGFRIGSRPGAFSL